MKLSLLKRAGLSGSSSTTEADFTAPARPPRSRGLPFSLSLLLLSLLLVSLLASRAHAQTEQFGDFRYASNGTAISITSYTGTGGAVTIPEVIAGLPVRYIAANAFRGKTTLTSVTIPAVVTSIGAYAFSGCVGLASAMFEGEAPSELGADPFEDTALDFAVYYHAGSEGFTVPVWRGYPSAVVGGGGGGPAPGLAAALEAPALTFTTGGGAPWAGQTAAAHDGVDAARSGRIGHDQESWLETTVTGPGTFSFWWCASTEQGYDFLNFYLEGDLKESLSGNPSWRERSYQIPAGPHTLRWSYVKDEEVSAGWDAGWVDEIVWTPEGGGGGGVPGHHAGFDYLNDGAAITITGYTGPGGAVTIPGAIAGLPVRVIGERAFAYQRLITSVAIPDSVTAIGVEAFDACTGLTRVDLPDQVTTLGNGAFQNCTGLTSVTLGRSVTSIGIYAFLQCVELASMVIPDSVTSIGNSAFSDCRSLASVVIPDSVTSIGNNAFWGCLELISVSIGRGVTSIGDTAFFGCLELSAIEVAAANPAYSSVAGVLFNKHQTRLIQYPPGKSGSYALPASVTSIEARAFSYAAGLTAVTIPDGVRSIGVEAFTNCRGLTSVSLPDSVIALGEAAFADCTGLTSVRLPDHLTAIETLTFGGCTSLTDVIFPSHLLTIETQAFEYCASLTSVIIPDSVTEIWNSAFRFCTSLTSVTLGKNVSDQGVYDVSFRNCPALLQINVAAGNTTYRSVDGVLFDAGQTTLLRYPAGRSGSYAVPGGVTVIGSDAFGRCTGLTSVSLPESITTIGGAAFDRCTGLTGLTLPDGLTSIEAETFAGCTGLTGLTLPESLTTIEANAFRGCTGLTSLTIPDRVATITGAAFSGCTGLTGITLPASLTSIESNAFYGCAALLQIGVAEGNTAYRGVGGVLFNAGQTTLLIYPPGKSGSYAVPAGVTTIGSEAFLDCKKLTGVTLPGSLSTIRDAAFAACKGLTSLSLPNSLTSLGMYAFRGCTGLTHLTLPDSLTSLDINTFYECAGLTSVTFGRHLTAIGDSAFKDCPGLTRLTFPASVETIGREAFMGGASLTGVTFLGSVTGIGHLAFSDCPRLTSAVFTGNAPTAFGLDVFDNTAAGFTIYYQEGRNGFTSPTWQGYPSAVLGDSGPPPLEDWRKQYFGAGATNVGEAADNADPDGDGLTNVEEYTAGTNPKSAASQWQAHSATKVGTTFTVGFTAQPGRRYTLQRLTTPGGAWQPVVTQEPLVTGGAVSLADPSAPPDTALYRVQVTLP